MVKIISKFLALSFSVVVFFLAFRLSLKMSSWLISGYFGGLEDISVPARFALSQVSIPAAAVAYLISSTIARITNRYIDSVKESKAAAVGVLALFISIVLSFVISTAFRIEDISTISDISRY